MEWMGFWIGAGIACAGLFVGLAIESVAANAVVKGIRIKIATFEGGADART